MRSTCVDRCEYASRRRHCCKYANSRYNVANSCCFSRCSNEVRLETQALTCSLQPKQLEAEGRAREARGTRTRLGRFAIVHHENLIARLHSVVRHAEEKRRTMTTLLCHQIVEVVESPAVGAEYCPFPITSS